MSEDIKEKLKYTEESTEEAIEEFIEESAEAGAFVDNDEGQDDSFDSSSDSKTELATFDVQDNELIDEHPEDTVVEKGLRKLNPKFKNKAEKKAERDALSELEEEEYTPEEHEPVYDIAVDKKIYSNNYAMAAFLILFGFIVWPYTKAATALLVFYGCGVAWMAYKGIKTKLHVDGTTFTIEGTKYPGTYTFDQVEKMIYVYNKKYQRRYYIHVDGKKICEIPPGAEHSRWLYDDMMAYGVPGGWYNKL